MVEAFSVIVGAIVAAGTFIFGIVKWWTERAPRTADQAPVPQGLIPQPDDWAARALVAALEAQVRDERAEHAHCDGLLIDRGGVPPHPPITT
ncbi:hypothetical protein PZ938_10170 [Luteipulveratus sp. YIM 133132]|uniref:hypothetical protein n=1 Tax=Luteipulveratus flavus TaxID=3031728 RepID=UPI0023AE9A6D|nr:hypothetical protein [Luteipulveratus sp. YIM 133132]MDE9365968.1 hypothetical protein [Luteipulveratus sp. YIM 133132]